MTDPQKVSRTAWFDVPVADLADGMSFYEGLLGWKYQQMKDSPLSDYVMIDVQGTCIGGLRKVAKSSGPKNDGAVLYFTVEDLAPKISRAKELGAEIVGDTVHLGAGRGSYQWLRDRAGNLIGLWAPQ